MEWAQVAIRHVQYGEGMVLSCDRGFIKVRFDNGGEKSFVYPDAFERFLRAVDPAVAAAVTGDIIMKKAEENAIAREQAAIREAIAAARAADAQKTPAKKNAGTSRTRK